MSHRIRLAPVFIGLFVLVGALGLQGSQAAVSSTLNAGFDADGNIYLSFLDGTAIGTPTPPGTLIPSGTYQLVLNNNTEDDLGDLHKFHLTGPGVNFVATQVQMTVSVTFQPASTYIYQDDIHPTTREVFGTPGSGSTSTAAGGGSPSSSSGSTSSGSGSTSSGSSSSGKSSGGTQSAIGTKITTAVFRGTLTGAISSAGKLTLTRNGKGVSNLKSGRYKIAVTDKTSKGGFTVQEIRKQAVMLTGASFVGTRTVTVDLKVGQWMAYAGAGKKYYFIVIS